VFVAVVSTSRHADHEKGDEGAPRQVGENSRERATAAAAVPGEDDLSDAHEASPV
jgi:hypothetical protein